MTGVAFTYSTLRVPDEGISSMALRTHKADIHKTGSLRVRD